MIANADMTEIYQWTPTNSAEVVAFCLARQEGMVDLTRPEPLTLTGAEHRHNHRSRVKRWRCYLGFRHSAAR